LANAAGEDLTATGDCTAVQDNWALILPASFRLNLDRRAILAILIVLAPGILAATRIILETAFVLNGILPVRKAIIAEEVATVTQAYSALLIQMAIATSAPVRLRVLRKAIVVDPTLFATGVLAACLTVIKIIAVLQQSPLPMKATAVGQRMPVNSARNALLAMTKTGPVCVLIRQLIKENIATTLLPATLA